LCENRERPALACNGKCYLKKQLQKNLSAQHSDDSHQHQKSAPQIDFSKYPVAPVSYETIVLSRPKNVTNNEWHSPPWKPSTYFPCLLRPPIPFSFHAWFPVHLKVFGLFVEWILFKNMNRKLSLKRFSTLLLFNAYRIHIYTNKDNAFRRLWGFL